VNVRGKTILVTGAGRGIGRSLATHFAGKGANLALLDVNADDVNETRARCTQLGVTARSYLADAANEDSVVGALGRVMEDFGALDGLINNAGIVRDGMLIKVKDGQVVGKMSLAQWQAVIDTNLTGVFLCAREAAQHMISRNVRGVIVNVSSISRAGNAGQTNYSAAKAGVAAVAPGFIRTPMVEAMKPEALAKMTSPIPLGRLGEPDEIAHAVGFIFENDLFTGRCVEVDAGLRL